jgi:signal transduction histidine kinase
LNEVIERVVQAVTPTAEKKGITISLSTDDEIGALEIDGDKISEAILNLILNAVEAIDAPQGRIEITTELDTPNRQVLVTIADDGAGIEDVEAIFEPFYSTGKKTHTGLGLPAARKIIALHNGTIEVQSKPGEGSTFTIKLPLA